MAAFLTYAARHLDTGLFDDNGDPIDAIPIFIGDFPNVFFTSRHPDVIRQYNNIDCLRLNNNQNYQLNNVLLRNRVGSKQLIDEIITTVANSPPTTILFRHMTDVNMIRVTRNNVVRYNMQQLFTIDSSRIMRLLQNQNIPGGEYFVMTNNFYYELIRANNFARSILDDNRANRLISVISINCRNVFNRFNLVEQALNAAFYANPPVQIQIDNDETVKIYPTITVQNAVQNGNQLLQILANNTSNSNNIGFFSKSVNTTDAQINAQIMIAAADQVHDSKHQSVNRHNMECHRGIIKHFAGINALAPPLPAQFAHPQNPLLTQWGRANIDNLREAFAKSNVEKIADWWFSQDGYNGANFIRDIADSQNVNLTATELQTCQNIIANGNNAMNAMNNATQLNNAQRRYLNTHIANKAFVRTSNECLNNRENHITLATCIDGGSQKDAKLIEVTGLAIRHIGQNLNRYVFAKPLVTVRAANDDALREIINDAAYDFSGIMFIRTERRNMKNRLMTMLMNVLQPQMNQFDNFINVQYQHFEVILENYVDTIINQIMVSINFNHQAELAATTVEQRNVARNIITNGIIKAVYKIEYNVWEIVTVNGANGANGVEINAVNTIHSIRSPSHSNEIWQKLAPTGNANGANPYNRIFWNNNVANVPPNQLNIQSPNIHDQYMNLVAQANFNKYLYVLANNHKTLKDLLQGLVLAGNPYVFDIDPIPNNQSITTLAQLQNNIPSNLTRIHYTNDKLDITLLRSFVSNLNMGQAFFARRTLLSATCTYFNLKMLHHENINVGVNISTCLPRIVVDSQNQNQHNFYICDVNVTQLTFRNALQQPTPTTIIANANGAVAQNGAQFMLMSPPIIGNPPAITQSTQLQRYAPNAPAQRAYYVGGGGKTESMFNTILNKDIWNNWFESTNSSSITEQELNTIIENIDDITDFMIYYRVQSIIFKLLNSTTTFSKNVVDLLINLIKKITLQYILIEYTTLYKYYGIENTRDRVTDAIEYDLMIVNVNECDSNGETCFKYDAEKDVDEDLAQEVDMHNNEVVSRMTQINDDAEKEFQKNMDEYILKIMKDGINETEIKPYIDKIQSIITSEEYDRLMALLKLKQIQNQNQNQTSIMTIDTNVYQPQTRPSNAPEKYGLGLNKIYPTTPDSIKTQPNTPATASSKFSSISSIASNRVTPDDYQFQQPLNIMGTSVNLQNRQKPQSLIDRFKPSFFTKKNNKVAPSEGGRRNRTRRERERERERARERARRTNKRYQLVNKRTTMRTK